MTKRNLTISVAVTAFVANAALAGPPQLNLVGPPLWKAGAETVVRFDGDRFLPQMQLVLPFAADVRESGGSPSVWKFTIKPATDTPPGIYPVRVRTAEGLSSLRLIVISDLPTFMAEEPNDRLADAQPMHWPAAMYGELSHPARDVETFRFSVDAGQRLTFVTFTRQLGLSPDVLIRLRDDRGRELAYRDNTLGLHSDERLDCTFHDAGEYTIELHDTDVDNAGWTNLFCLAAGPLDYARAVFPLGGRRGETVQLVVTGRDGQARVIETRVPNDSWHDHWRLPLADFPASLPWELASGEWPEAVEGGGGSGDAGTPETRGPGPQRLSWPVTVNGCISVPDEEDLYSIALTPGERVRVFVEAYHLGSALDGQLLVYDPAGQRLLAQNNDVAFRANIDPAVDFEVPAGVLEACVSLRDCFQRGGLEYGYRLTVERGGEDFYLALGHEEFLPQGRERMYDVADTLDLPPGQPVKLPISVFRGTKPGTYYSSPSPGFQGPILLQACDVPPGVSVEPVTVAAGELAAELTFAASADAPRGPFEVGIVGEARLADGTVVRHIAERQLFLYEPANTHMPWNWRVRRVLCAVTSEEGEGK